MTQPIKLSLEEVDMMIDVGRNIPDGWFPIIEQLADTMREVQASDITIETLQETRDRLMHENKLLREALEYSLLAVKACCEEYPLGEWPTIYRKSKQALSNKNRDKT